MSQSQAREAKESKLREGDSFVIPAGSLTLSLDLAQSSGRFFRPGITWFLKQLYFQGSSVLKCEAWDFSLFCRSQSFC